MSRKSILTLVLFLLFPSATILASSNPEPASRRAVSENSAESKAAVAELRSRGPAGLVALLLDHREEIGRHITNPLEPATPEWERLTAALDEVSQQKDSYLSRLYWYTDLAQAEAAAKASGKPILSLRLLGNLNEEFSCANSRFFRTVLYSNAHISEVLRDHFILHWQSVRPAPHITIDFGDGRRLERTITGNSIHYVLTADGRVIDALPGLYGPAAFLRQLSKAQELATSLLTRTMDEQQQALIDYHLLAVKDLTANWLEDARIAGGKIPERLLPKKAGNRAVDISSLAMTKAITEFSILKSMTRDADSLQAVTDEETWKRIAAHHLDDARLDQQSIGLMRRKTLSVFGSADAETKLTSMVQKFEQSVALDSVRNEYVLHTQLHGWLATGYAPLDVNGLNDKVYAELFKTPKTDPWLGLFSEYDYTALDGGGILK